MKTDHHTASLNLHALAAALNALNGAGVADEARKAVVAAIKANADTLKEQTA